MKLSFTYCLAIAATGVLFAAAPRGDVQADPATNVNCNGCIGKKDLGKKAVTKKAIRKRAVTKAAIRKGAVNRGRLAKGAVNAAKLHATAQPAGIAFEEVTDAATGIAHTDTTMLTIGLEAPAQGYVRVSAYGSLEYGAQELVLCSLDTENEYHPASAYYATGDNSVPSRYRPLALTRVFEADEGPGTYYLVCSTDSGNAVQMWNTKLLAEYVPRIY